MNEEDKKNEEPVNVFRWLRIIGVIGALLGTWWGGNEVWDMSPHSENPKVIRARAVERCGAKMAHELNCGQCDPWAGFWRQPVCHARGPGRHGLIEVVMKAGDRFASPVWSLDRLVPEQEASR